MANEHNHDQEQDQNHNQDPYAGYDVRFVTTLPEGVTVDEAIQEDMQMRGQMVDLSSLSEDQLVELLSTGAFLSFDLTITPAEPTVETAIEHTGSLPDGETLPRVEVTAIQHPGGIQGPMQ